jgi:hypothetical protein
MDHEHIIASLGVIEILHEGVKCRSISERGSTLVVGGLVLRSGEVKVERVEVDEEGEQRVWVHDLEELEVVEELAV